MARDDHLARRWVRYPHGVWQATVRPLGHRVERHGGLANGCIPRPPHGRSRRDRAPHLQIALHTPDPLLSDDGFSIVTCRIIVCTIVGPLGVGLQVKRGGRAALSGGLD